MFTPLKTLILIESTQLLKKMRLISYVAILLFFFGCKTTTGQKQIAGVNEWRMKFDQIAQKKDSYITSLSLSNDSRQHYNLSYYLDAYGTMYKVTREEMYLEKFFILVENVISQAQYSYTFEKSQYKDQFLGWTDQSSPVVKNHGGEYPLYESYCWRYVTDVLLFLNRNSDILESKNYQQRYQNILDFTEKNIFEKWLSRGENHLYRSNTHMFSHWARIGFDLHKITDKSEYADVYEEFNNRMGNKLNFSTGNVKMVVPFTTFWSRKKNKILDTNHANATVGTIIKMYDESVYYDQETVQGIIALFDKVIWKNTDNYAKFIDGSGKGTGSFSDGWIKLGRYDLNLQKRLESHKRGRSIQYYANLCYNAQFH